MTLSLATPLKKYFAASSDMFTAIMQLRGRIYRELENRRTQRIEFNGQGYFLKQHYGIGWKEIFKNLLQLRAPIISAKNEWQALQRLPQLGIATMELVGFGKRGWNPARQQSFLLTAELTDTVSLEELCQTWQHTPPLFKQKLALLKAVANISRRLHAHGINHRDFYLCHFLIKRAELHAPEPTLYLIDLHRAQIRNQIPQRWQIKDLAGLYFSSKECGLTSRDLLRFIREYRKCPWRDILINERLFWDKVKQRGDRTYRQHQQ